MMGICVMTSMWKYLILRGFFIFIAMQQKNSEKQAALINVSRPAKKPHAIDEITEKLANQR